MINFRLLRNSDFALWICVALLVTIGFLAIYSATFSMVSKKNTLFENIKLDPLMFVKRHFVSFLIAIVGMVGFAYMDYENFRNASFWLYSFMVLLLLAVIVIGYETYGAQRWIGIGFLSLQPSEISKIIMILVIARFIDERKGVNNYKDLGLLLGIVALPFLLIFKQPDLGTALVLLGITLGMIVFGNASSVLLLTVLTPLLSAALSFNYFIWIPYLVILGFALYFSRQKTFDFSMILGLNIFTGLVLPFVWSLLKVYQKQRLLAFLNPGADPFGAGYHTIQSQIAIGGGGFFGSGFLHGTQTQLQFIPQQWTDFIFSVIGEEFGFIGSALVVVLFLIIIWRAIVIAMNARDFYGSLIAGGIAAMYAFHVFVNIGMTLGIAPVVGIPLPLLSYGGTSLIVNLCAIGILQSISMRRLKLFF